MSVMDSNRGQASAWTWPFRLTWFALWYIRELVMASVVVLKDNLTPGQASRPGIARVETHCRTDAEITLLAALITLTPGTLTMGTELSGPDGPLPDDGQTDHRPVRKRPEVARVLYVHGLYNENADDLRVEIHEMERRLLHGWRRDGGLR